MNFLKLYINDEKQESNQDHDFNSKVISNVFETFKQVSEAVEEYYFNNGIDLYEDDNDVLFILEELENKLYYLLDNEEYKIMLDDNTELKAVALTEEEQINYIVENFNRFKGLFFDDEERYSIDLINNNDDLDSYINDNIFNTISDDYSFKTNSNRFFDPDNTLNSKMLELEYAYDLTLNLKDALNVDEFRNVKYPFIVNFDGTEEFNIVDISEDVDDLETIKDIFKDDYRF
ncbi:hypothetical protein [Nosocomiicoccus ampullae]|uniref:hypothetical protein n=1 Tax=Nosocomiicoccus ampullae TaxID=489910 RepID=UPI001C5DC30A|nr:hypothetical protein [Nosocomiicoccus ampullae]QYA47965.1 hypothetical protein KPF52_05780 [Nosocomiicoccus ampullae]